MKSILQVLCGLLLVASASAETVGLSFRDVPVTQFAESVIKGVLGRDYIIASGVGGDAKVSMSVKALDKSQSLDVVKGVLKTAGVDLVERGGVIYLERLSIAAPGGFGLPAQAQGPLSQNPIGPMAKPSPIEDQVPAEVDIYQPRYRAPELFIMAAKLAGVRVVESKQAGAGAGVVFAGSKENMDKARDLFAKMDKAPLSVQVRAAVLEYSDSSEKSRNLSAVLSLLTGKLGATVGATALNNSVSIRNSSIQAVMSAIDGDSRFRYLAEPTLRVLDGEKARLVVGSEVPVRGAVSQDKNGNALQSVDYRTAGVVLELKPSVFDAWASLAIKQTVSSFANTTTSGIDSPTVLKREAETVVDAKYGELVILAGMDESRESKTDSGLTWLPIFGQHSETKSNSRILLLLEVKRGEPI